MMKLLNRFKFGVGVLVVMYLCAICTFAQTSTVSFTVQDPTAQVYANGTVSYSISPGTNYIFNGSPLAKTYYNPQVVTLDGTGSGTISGLPRNDYITPINNVWKFVVCSNTSAPCVTVYSTVTTATTNISSIINASIQSISLPISNMPRAYNDNEIATSISQGGIYYNTFSAPGLRYWTGSGFAAIGSGGGGTVSITDPSNMITFSPSPLTGTGTATVNVAHAFTWSGTHIWSDGASPANTVEIYKDATYGEGVFFNYNGAQIGGVTNNSLVTGTTLYTTGASGAFNFCYPMSCTNKVIFGETGTQWNLYAGAGNTLRIGQGTLSENINGTYIGGASSTGSITNTTNTTTVDDVASVALSVSGVTEFSVSSTSVQANKPITINGTNNGGFFPTAPLPAPIVSDGAIFVGPDGNIYTSDNGAAFARTCNATNGVCSSGGGIADFTIAVAGGTQGANSCSAISTPTVTGLTTAMAILPAYTTDPGALTGWGSSAGMSFKIWPSAANTASWKVCNTTAASITYSAITFVNAVK